MKREKRMHNPEDELRKRSHSYLGETVHNYFGLPGKYKGAIENEIPDKDGNQKRTDGSYIVEYNGNDMIINIEDESSGVRINTLDKSMRYMIHTAYAHNSYVYSAITTPVPLEKCEKHFNPTNTFDFTPNIISFDEFDGDEKLKKYKFKVNRNECFSGEEGYDLILIPRMFQEKNDEVLEEVCVLFSKMRMENGEMKFELAKCLECMINKYAKTIDDINRLEGMLNMTRIVNYRKEFEDNLRKEGLEEGMEKGMIKEREKNKKEKLHIAKKIAEKLSIEEAVEITGLKKEEILTGIQ